MSSNKRKGIEVKLGYKHNLNPNEKRITLSGFSYNVFISNADEVNATKLEVYKKISEEKGITIDKWTPECSVLADFYDERLALYTKKDGGKPKTWSESLKICLWYDVQKFLSYNSNPNSNLRPKISRSRAFKHLAKQVYWQGNTEEILSDTYEKCVKKSKWLPFAEQIGWEEFGKIHSSLIELETRKEALEESARIDKAWKDSFTIKNL